MAVAARGTKPKGGAMFSGEHQHTLDPKGRVILPAVFREQLTEGLVMTVGLDYCIAVHPRSQWDRLVAGLRALKSTDARQRRFARMVLSSTHHDELDRQGRVTIPVPLRKYASLAKDVAVVGQDDKVEIWDAPRWAEYRDAGLADFADTDEPFGQGLL